MTDFLYEELSYKIIGVLFEVHKKLGKGFAEIVYKDAIEYEFLHNEIHFEREHEYAVSYKDTILRHKFYADFVVDNRMILEIKAVESLTDTHISQCLNYLKVSGNKLALLANFNKKSLEYKRIISK